MQHQSIKGGSGRGGGGGGQRCVGLVSSLLVHFFGSRVPCSTVNM